MKKYGIIILVALSFLSPFKEYSVPLQLDKLPSSMTKGEVELFIRRYQEASHHWLYRCIPRYKEKMCWYHVGPFCLWTLFGNDDDGIFGEGPCAVWRLDMPPSLLKAIMWTSRNPLHNYTFYLLGFAGSDVGAGEFVLADITPSKQRYFFHDPHGKTVFSGREKGFFVGFHALHPFISFRYTFKNNKKIECCCGWRERGNFGLKMAYRSEEIFCEQPASSPNIDISASM